MRYLFSKKEKDINQVEKIKKQDIEQYLQNFQKIFEKSNRNQSELALTLTDIKDYLEEITDKQNESSNDEISNLVVLLVEVADMVEAFYKYTQNSQNEALASQGDLMWRSLLKKYTLSGLSRIPDESTELNVEINQTVGTDPTSDAGVISQTVKSGYIYKGKTIRKSEIIVGTRKD